MQDATQAERIRRQYESLSPLLDERVRRQWAAAEAMSLGWGGLSLVAAATGLARNTIAVGVGELEHPLEEPGLRIRNPGGGQLRGRPSRRIATYATINTQSDAAAAKRIVMPILAQRGRL